MGLLLSVLIVCVGVLEALDCYYHLRAGLLPPARGHGPTSGWRQHLTNLNERWRRKPSALTCGGGSGHDGGGSVGGGEEDQRIRGDAPSSNAGGKKTLEGNGIATNGHCQANGHKAGALWQPQDVLDCTLNELLADEVRAAEKLTSSQDRPVTISMDVTVKEESSDLLEDRPRRLSEAFPELENIPPPNLAKLRIEADLPRRLSDIEAEVPSPLPLTHGDIPRRLSENFYDMPPVSPKKSKMDISWPSHPSHHIGLSKAGGRLQEVMSVDIESDDVFQPGVSASGPANTEQPIEEEDLLSVEELLPQTCSSAEKSLQIQTSLVPPEPEDPFRAKTPSSPVDEIPPSGIEYHELQELLDFFEKHGSDASAMQLWNERKRRTQPPLLETAFVENPSRQYTELQVFLQNRGDGPDALAKAEEPQHDSEYVGPQVSQEPQVGWYARSGAAMPEHAVPSREYMELQNFLNVLKAQEAHPSDTILDKYFADERKREQLSVRQTSVGGAPPPTDTFHEFRELQTFLESQRGQQPPTEPLPPMRDRALSSGMINESTECPEVRSQPLKTPTPGERATVSTETQTLGRARSHSFEDATPNLTESIIKATLEAAAARTEDDDEDDEVAAISRLAELKSNVTELVKIDEKKHEIENKIKALEKTPSDDRKSEGGEVSTPTPGPASSGSPTPTSTPAPLQAPGNVVPESKNSTAHSLAAESSSLAAAGVSDDPSKSPSKSGDGKGPPQEPFWFL